MKMVIYISILITGSVFAFEQKKENRINEALIRRFVISDSYGWVTDQDTSGNSLLIFNKDYVEYVTFTKSRARIGYKLKGKSFFLNGGKVEWKVEKADSNSAIICAPICQQYKKIIYNTDSLLK